MAAEFGFLNAQTGNREVVLETFCCAAILISFHDSSLVFIQGSCEFCVILAMELIKRENNGHTKSKENVPEYGRVILTLKNCLLPEDKLSPTPSFQDGLDAETEADLRILGCELIQTAGILLRLPQVSLLAFCLTMGRIASWR